MNSTSGCLCREIAPECAERGFRKSPDGLGLGHGPRIAGADPPLRTVDGSDPSLRDARCGIGAVRHVQAHATLPAGSLPDQQSVPEGWRAPPRGGGEPVSQPAWTLGRSASPDKAGTRRSRGGG